MLAAYSKVLRRDSAVKLWQLYVWGIWPEQHVILCQGVKKTRKNQVYVITNYERDERKEFEMSNQ